MIKIKSILSFERIIYFFITLFILLFFFRTGTIYYPDSDGYIQMDIYRSSGYPLFILIHKILFGKNYISFLLITQLGLALGSIFFLIKCLKRTLHLNKCFSLIVFTLLLVPLFFEIKVANIVLSEALAYPLYLSIMGNLLIAIINKKHINFYYSLLLLFILIQVRGQFLFLVPVLIIGILLSEYKQLLKKRNIILIIATLSLPILSVFTDIAFHKFKHNQPVPTPWTGVQIAAMPFFVSEKDDYKLFDTKEKQEYFKYIYSKLNDKKLLLNLLPKEDTEPIDFYYANYVAIANGTLNGDGELFFDKTLPQDQKTILTDKINSSVAIPLIKGNFTKYLKLYFQNISKGIGTTKNLILILLLTILSLVSILKKENKLAKFIFIGCLSILGNIALVAIAEPAVSRYVFYNNWILITIVLLLYQNTFLKKSND